MPGDKEKLTELQKQKGDIEMLLSSLEEAYNDASLSEEHYNEVKGKNQKKLEEISAEIAKLEKKAGKVEPAAAVPAETPVAESASVETKEQPKEEPKEEKPEKKSKKEKGKKKKQEIVDEDLPIIPVSQAGPGEGLGGDEPAPAVTPPELDKKKITKDIAAVGTSVGTGDIKNIITKLVNEIRPAGIEVLPRIEKMGVQLEKLKTFIEAVKSEKEGNSDTVRRIMEEIGEIRSNVASADGRLSDASMKVDDMTETLKALKPERFTKLLTKLDSGIKENDAKLEKLDEITSIMIKKIGLIEDVLREMGSLEKVVEFSKNIASRMIVVDDTEKRITRVGKKIDGIFMELSKRLEEFMLYKAKQDTTDELIQEMMKSMDDVNTKVSGMSTKEELEEMRDMLETKISAASTSTGASANLTKYQEQKDEINSVLEMMEEQYKSGALKKEEYEKAKTANLERMKEIEKKIQEERAKPSVPETIDAPAPGTEPEASPASAPTEGEAPSGDEGTKPTETDEKEKPKEPETSLEEPIEKSKEEEPKKEEVKKPTEIDEKEKPKEQTKETKKEEKPKEEPKLSKKEMMLKELEESFKSGLISKEAYEKTKKLLGG